MIFINILLRRLFDTLICCSAPSIVCCAQMSRF